jgi:hypothetical protein
VINRKILILTITAAIFLSHLYAGYVCAAAEGEMAAPKDEEMAAPSLPGEAEDDEETVTVSAEEGEPADIETHTLVRGFMGYRFLTLDGYGGRAAPYEYLHPGMIGGGTLNSIGKDLKIAVDGAFNSEKDYHADLLYDYAGYYRFHLRSEALFHNLGHEQLFSQPFNLGSSYTPVDADPSSRNGVKTQQDQASARIKLKDYPVHLNIGYWRMHKTGTSQLHFADQAFEGGANSIYSVKRGVDLETHEGNIGFDAHLGTLDLIYLFRIRQFEDQAGIPRDPFVARPDRNAGSQEHSEDPDSRFYSHTVKLHTSLSGGIVGAASYSYAKRDNLSKLSDIRGAGGSTATLNNVAGDFTYTPCKWFSSALKYRRMEVDRTTPVTLTSSFFLTPVIDVRPNVDTKKDILTFTLSFRPIDLLTFKGEYKGEYLHRGDLQNSTTNSLLNWHLPENTEIHRGTFTVLSQPFKGLRLKALYSYSATNNPAYGNSFENKHEGQLQATYAAKKRWGVAANYRSSQESNDHVERITFDSFAPLTYSALPLLQAREKKTNNLTTSFWVSPIEKLTLSASFAFLHNSTDQTVLYGSLATSPQGLTNYTNQAQVWTLNSVYRFNEKLDLSLTLQQVRSFAEFDPALVTVNAANDTTGIKELSSLKTVENSISTRVGYHFNKRMAGNVDYTYRKYDEENSTLFDGTVQTIVAYLTATW